MFDKLSDLLIVKEEYGIATTFPVGLGAVAGGIKVIDHLFVEEKEDYERSDYTKIRLPANISALETLQSLKTRFMSRIISYIVTVCTIDGVLERSYTHFLNCLKQIGYNHMIPTDRGKELLHRRKEEIQDYLFYRNKVFAHTTFAYPTKADSRSLQHSSLYYFSGNLLYLKDEYLALGGGSIIVDKEERPPELSIIRGYYDLRHHYSLWEDMFTDILEDIPHQELERKIDRINII